ncbi:MAG TPA: tripartite tricarboxylate transporter permease [Clostridia bacterium]|nr:tripartite tricarboxylate transporter permease [Clostridia bacterium]
MAELSTIFMSTIFDPAYLLVIFSGVVLGICFGAMPGLTAPMGIAILLPLTYVFEPTMGLGMLMGLYCGAVYGGTIPAILINIPGTPSAMMTAIEGYEMAKKGEAGKAIGFATIASFIGGTISVFFLIAIAPFLGRMALKFGPPEFFAVGVFGLSIIAGITGKSLYKGVIAAAIGLFVTVIGMDPIDSTPRFTYGNINLLTGFSFVPMMVGLFGFREVLLQVGKGHRGYRKTQAIKNIIPSFAELKENIGTMLRGSVIGTFVGALPGAGGPIAAFMSYDTTQRISKEKEKFGTGYSKGIAASESANNAVTGGALIPLLTLGIPGDAAVAIILGALMMHDLSPGPMLFQLHGEVVTGMYISLFLANAALLFVGLLGAKMFVKILKIPLTVLLPIIVVLCVVGSYAVNNSMFDIIVMVAFGMIGYLVTKIDIPIVPIVLGIVLGPMIEQNLRTSLLLSQGNWSVFVTRPISLTILLITFVLLAWPYVKKYLPAR